MKTQQKHEWRDNHPRVLKQIKRVQHASSTRKITAADGLTNGWADLETLALKWFGSDRQQIQIWTLGSAEALKSGHGLNQFAEIQGSPC